MPPRIKKADRPATGAAEHRPMTSPRPAPARPHAMAGSWSWDVPTGALTWSPELFELFGILPDGDDASFKAWRSILHPDDAEQTERSLAIALSTHTALICDYRVVLPDGSDRWINVVGSGSYDHDGTPLRMIGLCLDITERKLAEEERHIREAHDRGFARAASDAIISMDLDGDVIGWNNAAEITFGRSEAEMLGKPFSFLIPERFREQHRAGLARVRAGGARHVVGRVVELAALRHDGVEIPIELSLSTWDGPSGPCFTAIMRDISDRKRAEQALHYSELKLRTVIENLPVTGVVLTDSAGQIIEANRTAVNILGLSHSDTVARSFDAPEWMIIRPDGTPMLSAEFASVRALREQQPIDDIEMGIIRPDGEVRWILTSAIPIPIDGFGVSIVFNDITERKQAQRVLLERETRLRNWFQLPLVGICITSPTKGWLEVNDHLCTMLGRSRTELESLTWADLTYPPDLALDETHFKQVLRGEIEDYSIEKRFVRKDGILLPVDLSVRCVRLPDGSVDYLIALLQDISKRKQAQAEAQESAGFYAGIFETSHAVQLLVDQSTGRIIAANPAAADFYGYPLHALIGLPLTDLTMRGAAEQKERLDAAARSGGSDFEMQHRLANGTVRDVWVYSSLVKTLQRPVLHAFVVDITERKQAEAGAALLQAKLQQAQRLESIGLLAGGIAHDFNNMLAVILGTVELASSRVDPAHPLHSDLLDIQSAATRSADLTRKLLSYARKQTIAPAALDLNVVVPRTTSILQRLIGEDILLRWELGEELWIIKMDSSQLDQILANLCVNARHAIADVGTVTIATANVVIDEHFCAAHADADPGEYVRLSVRDTGHGMDASTLAHIFEPFFSTKDVGTGTGLGLATVYGAVRQNHGFITVASERGHGTTFDIYLPRHDGSAATLQDARSVAVQHNTETILVVENEAAVRRIVVATLQRQGYRVLAAESGAEAIRVAEERVGEIDLLLTDVVMPGMNGRVLATTLRSTNPTLPVILMSGFAAGVLGGRGVEMDEVDFIEKPFAPGALEAKVRKLLDRA